MVSRFRKKYCICLLSSNFHDSLQKRITIKCSYHSYWWILILTIECGVLVPCACRQTPSFSTMAPPWTCICFDLGCGSYISGDCCVTWSRHPVTHTCVSQHVRLQLFIVLVLMREVLYRRHCYFNITACFRHEPLPSKVRMSGLYSPGEFYESC